MTTLTLKFMALFLRR